MSDLTRADIALLIGDLVLEQAFLRKRVAELEPPQETVDPADLPKHTSGAERAATREED